jgi:hypothetical protein
MNDQTQQHDHSELWTECKQEAQAQGVEWDNQRRSGLGTLDLNELRMAASVIDIAPARSKPELVTALVEAGCFLGPIGDETVYCEHRGEAVPLLTKQGVPPHTSWAKRRDSLSLQEGDL